MRWKVIDMETSKDDYSRIIVLELVGLNTNKIRLDFYLDPFLLGKTDWKELMDVILVNR